MWLTFIQNNPRGRTIIDDKYGIGDVIIIECLNEEHGAEIAENIIELHGLEEDKRILEDDNYEPYVDYCECCGVRWEFYDEDNEISVSEPTIYGGSIQEYLARNKWDVVFVHKLEGGFEKITYMDDKNSENSDLVLRPAIPYGGSVYEVQKKFYCKKHDLYFKEIGLHVRHEGDEARVCVKCLLEFCKSNFEQLKEVPQDEA